MKWKAPNGKGLIVSRLVKRGNLYLVLDGEQIIYQTTSEDLARRWFNANPTYKGEQHPANWMEWEPWTGRIG